MSSEFALELQEVVSREQSRAIARLFEDPGKEFCAYRRAYELHSKKYQHRMTWADVQRRISRADLIYVGDYHTHAPSQLWYLRVAATAIATKRRVVLALEFFPAKHQRVLDRYLRGGASERTLLRVFRNPYRGPLDVWPQFREILAFAKAKRLEVLAIDTHPRGRGRIAARDRFAALKIAASARARDAPMVCVLAGQFHVSPAHLPKEVAHALQDVQRASLSVYQNAEGSYWQLAREHQLRTEAVAVATDVVGLNHASPLSCQRSFLDYVEARIANPRHWGLLVHAIASAMTARLAPGTRTVPRFQSEMPRGVFASAYLEVAARTAALLACEALIHSRRSECTPRTASILGWFAAATLDPIAFLHRSPRSGKSPRARGEALARHALTRRISAESLRASLGIRLAAKA